MRNGVEFYDDFDNLCEDLPPKYTAEELADLEKESVVFRDTESRKQSEATEPNRALKADEKLIDSSERSSEEFSY